MTDVASWRIGSAGATLRQVIRANRRSPPLRFIARVAEKYLRAWHNESFFEFDRNGEAFALRQFARWQATRPLVVWDVGANDGSWATLARRMLPSAQIHSFEILPPIADRYTERMARAEWATLHRIGLSDRVGTTQMSWNVGRDDTSSLAMRPTEARGGEVRQVEVGVSTIDAMLGGGLPPPDLLKIDTEGHDAAVLRGAAGLLKGPDAPAMIQFEYGDTWLPPAETLERAQRQLEEAGYRLGRLFPDHVGFKAYEYTDDHFRMGNMIAVKQESLMRLLG
jgi:FkbM family methyltransferase